MPKKQITKEYQGNPSTSVKTYLCTLKRLVNDKKIPCITSLFHDDFSTFSFF